MSIRTLRSMLFGPVYQRRSRTKAAGFSIPPVSVSTTPAVRLESQQVPPQPLTQSERRKQRGADVLEHGWPAKDRELVVWLDQLYAGEWPTLLKQAADLPTSPFDDVRNWTLLEPIPATVNSSDVAAALALRGLQRQAAGDDEAYVENLRIGLALSRSLRDRAPACDLVFGRKVEGTLLKGLDRWLEKLHGKPDLIRQALALLSRHLDETVDDGKDLEAIEALIGQNTLDIPLSLDQYLSFYDGPTRQDSLSGRVRFVTARLVPLGTGSANSHISPHVLRRSATTELVHRPGKRTRGACSIRTQ